MSAKPAKPVAYEEPLPYFRQESARPVARRTPTPIEQMYAYFDF
jgi:hypothetical protein